MADCIEFKASKSGVYIEKFNGTFDVGIIEYKPTQPKKCEFNETDAIQAFGYKLCADYIWKCNSKAYIYYIDTKKRIELPFETEFERYYDMLKRYTAEMQSIIENNIMPEISKTQKCSGCSMHDICMPKIKTVSMQKMIMKSFEE